MQLTGFDKLLHRGREFRFCKECGGFLVPVKGVRCLHRCIACSRKFIMTEDLALALKRLEHSKRR